MFVYTYQTQILNRLADSTLPKVTHISFVGYSLGGLVIRYAIGALYARGLLVSSSTSSSPHTSSSSVPSLVHPLIATHFVTFASPHIGARRETGTAFDSVFNFGANLMTSRTGSQMMLMDRVYPDGWAGWLSSSIYGSDKKQKCKVTGRKMLALLADQELPFWKGLSLVCTTLWRPRVVF
jgi:hypothetical protein